MIKKFGKEEFLQEFEDLYEMGVDPIDAVLTILKDNDIDEEYCTKYLNERVIEIIKSDAQKLNFLKEKKSASLDDFD